MTAPTPVTSGDAARARRRRTWVRRAAAAAAVLAGLVGLLSALTPPLPQRLETVLGLVGLGIPVGASTALVPVSVALLLVARGLRRGNRVAWATALVLLLASAVLHLVKGLDVEEAVLATVVGGVLLVERRAFPVHLSHATFRLVVRLLGAGAAVVTGVTVVLVLLAGEQQRPRETVREVVLRLVGDTAVPLPRLGGHAGQLVDPLIAPALGALGLTLLVVVLLPLLGPAARRAPSPPDHVADREQAREVVRRWGGDTLAYFALRDDKEWFFSGGSVVAYSVRGGVCLVSPDPVGPPEEAERVLDDFLDHVERHGWTLAVVGATEEWVERYRAHDLRELYLGDEAVLDCSSFSLSGKAMKSLRGAVNRVRAAGITVELHDPARLDHALERDLRAMADQSRRGDAERGFSMTLSRLFDPSDTGLLLTVGRFADGRVAGFVQWVPAADIDGFSLDVMRRSTADDVPNGLTDHLIVETAAHLAEQGMRGLGLNFAVLREVVAGERDPALGQVGRHVLQVISRHSQMESLWRFNQKYDPTWRRRYVVLDGVENAAAGGLAVAGAEGLVDLPVLARFTRA